MLTLQLGVISPFASAVVSSLFPVNTIRVCSVLKETLKRRLMLSHLFLVIYWKCVIFNYNLFLCGSREGVWAVVGSMLVKIDLRDAGWESIERSNWKVILHSPLDLFPRHSPHFSHPSTRLKWFYHLFLSPPHLIFFYFHHFRFLHRDVYGPCWCMPVGVTLIATPLVCETVWST